MEISHGEIAFGPTLGYQYSAPMGLRVASGQTVWLVMKVNKVSAFRVKRGLRRASGAGPQVGGLTIQTNPEWKPVAMRRLIMRDTRSVEREKAHAAAPSFIRPPPAGGG